MKKQLALFFSILVCSVYSYADPVAKFSDNACDKFENSTDNNIFTDTDYIYSCNKWVDKNQGSEILSTKFSQKYPSLNLSEVHKLAKVNEFKARAAMGRRYFYLKARIKRISSSNGVLIFEVYNGAGNPYITDTIAVPLDSYRPILSQFWIWNETIKSLDENLSEFTDGDILTFVCGVDEWKVRSPYAEDFRGCVFWGFKKADSQE